MMRRILVIPFQNKYTKPDAAQDPYDVTNPNHRLRDDNLRDRLLSPEGQEQLLSWLVKGAKAWYKEGLGAMSPAINTAFKNYKEENDYLAIFIHDCCILGPQATCNASQFLAALNAHSGTHMKQKDLKELMAKRDFKYLTKGRFYRGIAVNEGSQEAFSHQSPM